MGPELPDVLKFIGEVDRVEEWQAHAATQAALFGKDISPPRVGRYLISARLGAGSMGVVYRGHDPSLGRDVAIKIVPPSSTVDGASREPAPAQLQRRLREARAIAAVSHPNVVVVHDVGVCSGQDFAEASEGSVYLVMELLEGESLRDRMLRDEPIDDAEALGILQTVARALAVAHGRGVVHRDVKPDNVHLGTDGVVRVLDFGLAFVGDERAGDDSVTQEGLSTHSLGGGTAPYMAPELRAGLTPANAATDQFALCVMAAELMFGIRPYAGFDARGLLRTRTRPSPVASACAQIFERGLRGDPSRRHRSVGAVAAKLAELRRPMRRWVPWAAAGAVSIAGVVGLFAATHPGGTPRECGDGASRISRYWGAEVRSSLGAKFRSASLPRGEDSWTAAAGSIDRFAAAWESAHAQTCSADVSPDLAQEAMVCLGHQLAGLGETVLALRSLDADDVERSPVLAEGLGTPAGCLPGGAPRHEDEAGVLARMLESDLLAKLRRADLLYAAGDLPGSLALAQTVARDSQRAGLGRLEAEAMMRQCKLSVAQNPVWSEDSDAACDRALGAAERALDTALVVEVLSIVAASELAMSNDHAQTRRFLDRMRTRLDAVEDPRRRTPLEIAWTLDSSRLEMYAGDTEASIRLAEQALQLSKAGLDPLDPLHLDVAKALGAAYAQAGALQRAREMFVQARDASALHYGASHPNTLGVQVSLAAVATALGESPLAISTLEEALAQSSTEAARVRIRVLLAKALVADGQLEAAQRVAKQLLALAGGERDTSRVLAWIVLAQVGAAAGSCEPYEEELTALDRALLEAGAPRSYGADMSMALGGCAQAQGRSQEAAVHFARALERFEALHGPRHRKLVPALVQLGSDQALQRAAQIVASTQGDPADARAVRAAQERGRLSE